MIDNKDFYAFFLTVIFAATMCGFFGCAERDTVVIHLPKIEPTGTFTSQTLHSNLTALQHSRGHFVANVDIRDSLYARVTKESARDIGKAVWRSGFRYSENAFDCEDYASLYQFVAVMGMQNHTALQAAPAVGTIYYLKQGSPHAINFVVVGPADGWEIYLVEPQTGEMTPLNQFDEILTIYRIII